MSSLPCCRPAMTLRLPWRLVPPLWQHPAVPSSWHQSPRLQTVTRHDYIPEHQYPATMPRATRAAARPVLLVVLIGDELVGLQKQLCVIQLVKGHSKIK